MAGRGHTWGCEEVWRIHPRSHLSIIAVCRLLSLFTSGSTAGIFPRALSDQSKSSLGNVFKDTSSQQVKRMLSRDWFSWFGPEQTVWCEKEPKRLKIATMYNFLTLVLTKASELSVFLGVNTPLNCVQKRNEAFTGLERHGGKGIMTKLSFWGGVSL